MNEKQKIDILFVLHDTEMSGAPMATLAMAELLRDRGWKVAVCAPNRGGCEALARKHDFQTFIVNNPAVAMADANVAQMVKLAIQRIVAILSYRRIVKDSRVRIVWCGSAMALMGAIGGWLGGAKVIQHIHEDLTKTKGNKVRVSILKRIAAALVFVAPKPRKAFGQPHAHQRWLTVPNPIDLSEFDRAIRQAVGSDQGEIDPAECIFLTVAWLSPRKGIDVLIDAFSDHHSRFPESRLFIVGQAPEEHPEWEKEYRERALASKASHAIHFLGHRTDVPTLMAVASVFVLASRNEALPLTIAEAMAAKRPVIATRVGSIDKMIRNGKSGILVDADDVEGIAQAMDLYAGEPKVRIAHGNAGRRRADKLFDDEAVAEKVELLLQALL